MIFRWFNWWVHFINHFFVLMFVLFILFFFQSPSIESTLDFFLTFFSIEILSFASQFPIKMTPIDPVVVPRSLFRVSKVWHHPHHHHLRFILILLSRYIFYMYRYKFIFFYIFFSLRLMEEDTKRKNIYKPAFQFYHDHHHLRQWVLIMTRINRMKSFGKYL